MVQSRMDVGGGMIGRACAFGVLGLLLLSAPAWADCDCQDTNSDGYPDQAGSCTQSTPATLTYASGVNGGVASQSVSITIADLDGNGTIACGMYANGDFWIVGEGSPKSVRVTGQSPTPASGNHGWMVNPTLNTNRLDSDIGSYSAPSGFPQTFTTGSGPVSYIAARSAAESDKEAATSSYPCQSNTRNSRSCLLFAGVFTFVDTAPTNSHTLFRPQYPGASAGKWTDLRVTDLADRLSEWPSLSLGSGNGEPSLAQVARRGRWAPLAAHVNSRERDLQQWKASSNWAEEFCVQKSSYGANQACSDSSAILRMFGSDFDTTLALDSASRKAMVGTIQRGIDILGGVDIGAGWGPPISQQTSPNAWGNIFNGWMITPYFAAYMLGDSELITLFQEKSEAGAFFESRLFNQYSDIVTQGWLPTENTSCPTLANNCSSTKQHERQYCSPTGGQRDAHCCTATKSYPFATSQIAQSFAAVVLLLDDAATTQDPVTVWSYDELLAFALGYGAGGTDRRGVDSGVVCTPGGQLANGTTPAEGDARGFNTFTEFMYTTYVAGITEPPAADPPAEPEPEPEVDITVSALTLYCAGETGRVAIYTNWTGEDVDIDLCEDYGFEAFTTGEVGAVRFELNGTPIRTEVNSPYACAEGVGGAFIGCPEFPDDGTNTLRVVPLDAEMNDVTSGALSITFDIVIEAEQEPDTPPAEDPVVDPPIMNGRTRFIPGPQRCAQ